MFLLYHFFPPKMKEMISDGEHLIGIKLDVRHI